MPFTLLLNNIVSNVPMPKISQSQYDGSGRLKQSARYKDHREYKLDMKMNSSIQTLHLNPECNFDMSLCVPGFEPSTPVPLKTDQDEDNLPEKKINEVELLEEEA